MKKTLTAALGAALVIGASSTALAATNPFSDVPRDHWAYDAVTQLAADGVVEGYGDGTFRGDRNITRYEMAQMVAKAMAKNDMSTADRALIDRLAAEFADELNNLGVRVSNLERNADMVKWTGELRYTYTKDSGNFYEREGGDKTDNELLLRLEPTAEVNAHWRVKARLDAATNMKTDSDDDTHDTHLSLERLYAEGTYGSTVIQFGRLPVFTEQGMILDDDLSGASVTFGKDQPLTATLFAGRYNLTHSAWGDEIQEARDAGIFSGSTTANLQWAHAAWQPSQQFQLAAEYLRLKQKDFAHDTAGLSETCNLWGIGATWRPTSTVYLTGGYWKNQSHEAPDIKNVHLKSYNIELGYKGADPEDAGSFGIYTAYRYVGGGATIKPTYDGAPWNAKGWEIGGQYTFAKNVVGSLVYFDGKCILTDSQLAFMNGKDKMKRIFGRVEFFF